MPRQHNADIARHARRNEVLMGDLARHFRITESALNYRLRAYGELPPASKALYIDAIDQIAASRDCGACDDGIEPVTGAPCEMCRWHPERSDNE